MLSHLVNYAFKPPSIKYVQMQMMSETESSQSQYMAGDIVGNDKIVFIRDKKGRTVEACRYT